MADQKVYLNEREISKLTGLSLSTLRNNRSQKRGFPYAKIGKSVRYALQDVENYMQNHIIKTIERY